MDYGALIADSFRVTVRHPFLWFFGLFAAGGSSCSGSGPGGGTGSDPGDLPEDFFEDVPLREIGTDGTLASIGTIQPWVQETEWLRWLSENLVLIVVAGVALAVVVAGVLIALRVLSEGALIGSVAALDRGESRGFVSTWRTGVSFFWRVLGVKVLFWLITLGLLLAVVVPAALVVFAAFSTSESLAVRILAIGLSGLAGGTVLIVTLVMLSIAGELALREAVLGGRRVFGAVGGAFGLFRRNLGRALLVWLIQVGLMLAAGIALLVLALLIGLLLFVPVAALVAAEDPASALVIVAGVVAGLLLLAIFLVGSGAIGTFNSSYWTLAYEEIVSQSPDPAEPPES